VEEFHSSKDPFVDAFRSGRRFQEDWDLMGKKGVDGFPLRDAGLEF